MVRVLSRKIGNYLLLRSNWGRNTIIKRHLITLNKGKKRGKQTMADISFHNAHLNTFLRIEII